MKKKSEREKELTEYWNKFKTLKPEFDKIRKTNYEEALKFWKERVMQLLAYPLEFTIYIGENAIPPHNEEDLFEMEDVLTIAPNPANKGETGRFNKWLHDYYLETTYNIEKVEAKFLERFNKSLDKKELIEFELSREIEHPLKDIIKMLMKAYKLEQYEPDWNEEQVNSYKITGSRNKIKLKTSEVPELYARAKSEVKYNKYLNDLLEELKGDELSTNDSIEEKEIEGIKKWNLRTRFYLLQKMELLNTSYFKGNNISQNDRFTLIANILKCSPRNAKKIFNNEDKPTEQEKKEVELYLNSLK